jgi:hypothetical protein
MRDLAPQTAMLFGITPVDGLDILGQPLQVRAETRHRVLRRGHRASLSRASAGDGIGGPNGWWQKLLTARL